MTLTEARKTFERYRNGAIAEDLREAIDAAITVLPRTSWRPSAKKRLEIIRESIRDAKGGFDPFQSRSRKDGIVCWRQCVWKLLAIEGYRNAEIARASKYDHASVWWGLQRLNGYLELGDRVVVTTWQELNHIMGNGTQDR